MRDGATPTNGGRRVTCRTTGPPGRSVLKFPHLSRCPPDRPNVTACRDEQLAARISRGAPTLLTTGGRPAICENACCDGPDRSRGVKELTTILRTRVRQVGDITDPA